MLPPIRSYTDSEKIAIFHQNRFDSYLLLSSGGVNRRDFHVPVYSNTNVAVSGDNSGIYGSGATETSGGYTVRQLSSVDTKAEVFDFNSGSLVCKCEAHTDVGYTPSGITFATDNSIVSSACSELVAEMCRNNLFWGTKSLE